MAFPIVAPSFLREYIDFDNPEKNAGLVRYVISPHSVDYVLMLANPAVAKRLIEHTDPILFTMTDMSDEDSAKFSENAKALIARYPNMQYYWQIRQLVMYILQFKKLHFDRRLLIMNHAIGTVNGMITQFQPNLIEGFAQNITHTTDFSETLKYFEKVPIIPPVSLAEGVSFLKAMFNTLKNMDDKTVYKKWKPFYERIYKGLGISGPETFTTADMKLYIPKRVAFGENFTNNRPHIMENIMINYLWALATPFTDPELSVWDNFVFYITLYNAIKIYITLIEPADDDDLASALSAFDIALTEVSAGNAFLRSTVSALKNQDSANNGDMAVITLN
ncbi:MAG: hypothetical protein LBM59_07830 [Ruminococcus sp.]|jgi:hypothetical protein|nr:hypothetical protein [Ruminococcus sp.]